MFRLPRKTSSKLLDDGIIATIRYMVVATEADRQANSISFNVILQSILGYDKAEQLKMRINEVAQRK